MKRLVSRHSRRMAGDSSSFRRRCGATNHLVPPLPTVACNGYLHHFSFPQMHAFFSSSTSLQQSFPDEFHQRVELDSSLPLSFSVKALLKIPLGKVHYLDFYNKFPNIIRACCKAGKLDQAQLLLKRMLQEKRESGRVVPAKVFETVIFGYARQLAHKEPKKAIANMMDIVALMEREYEYDYQHALEQQDDKSAGGDSSQPRTETYNTVLRGMMEAAPFLPSAARQAEELLDTMERAHRERGWHTKPNNRSYTYVISAYGNSRHEDSGDLAQQVLERMKKVHQIEAEAFESTNGVSYEEALSRPGYCKDIVTPDRAAYTAVVQAHAQSRSKDSANKAYAVLTEMHSLLQPDAIAITTCINAFANVASRSSGNKRNRVPAEQREEAAQSAEALLLLMGDLAREQQENNVNSSVDEEVIDVVEWDDEDQVDVRQSDTSLLPTVITYNSVLNAFARSDTRESAPRAEALLQEMLETCLNDDNAVKPNRTSFNTVINAWARFSRYDPEAPVKAEDLMNLMYDLYYSGKLESVKPDAVTYTTVINAWARAENRTDKVQNARRLLDAMLSKFEADEDDMKPNIMAYTSVLNAAVHSPSSSPIEAGCVEDAFTSDSTSDDVYTILLQTYNEVLKDPYNIGLSPDHFVFATMLQAIQQHTAQSSAERRQMVELVFDDACAAGEVSSFVIRALRTACPSIDLLERLLGSKLARDLQDVSQLPQDWSRNLDFSPRLRKVDRLDHRRDTRRSQRNNRKRVYKKVKSDTS